MTGFPSAGLPEFCALAFAFSFLIFPELRARQQDFWGRWKIRPAYLWILLAVLVLAKGTLWISGAHSGFSACYRSPAEPTNITHEDLPAMECERSYENPFGRFSATRLDDSIWFGQDGWNLVFLNTSRYNYYNWEPGNILRPRIPIQAEWNGYPDIPPGESDPDRICRRGHGRLGRCPRGIAAGICRIERRRNTRRHSKNPCCKSNILSTTGRAAGRTRNPGGRARSINVVARREGFAIRLAARSAPAGWRILALLADGLILLWILSCLPAIWQSVRGDLIPLIAFSIGIGLFSLVPAAPVIRGIGITSCWRRS